MAKDPAFLFYPGDYLRDTQCLSEKAQVSYDRIMCEHMRNICISQQQLKFFTKKLTEDELEELMLLLKKIQGGYQIEWVAESIEKRRAYSESRRKNRKAKPKPKDNNTSSTYDSHMENVNVIESVIEDKEGGVGETKLNNQAQNIFQALCEYFGVSEISNIRLFKELYNFVLYQQTQGNLSELENQCASYIEYKKKAGTQVHGVLKFIGEAESGYNGGWNQDNWQHKLLNYKEDGKPNRKISAEGLNAELARRGY